MYREAICGRVRIYMNQRRAVSTTPKVWVLFAFGPLQVPWTTGDVDAQLWDEQLQKEMPFGRLEPAVMHNDGLKAENVAVCRHRHGCDRAGERSRIATSLAGELVSECAAIPPKNVPTIRVRLFDGYDASSRDAPLRNCVRPRNGLR